MSVWASGVWGAGVWADGVWAETPTSCVWGSGVWANGVWANGVWYCSAGEVCVWEHGVWADGVWADGVWHCGTAAPEPEPEVPATPTQASGGWLAYNDAERARRKREQEEAEREIEALERHLVAEKILATPSENLNAARLRLLAEQYRGSDLLDKRAQRALAYAERAKTELSVQLALRELQRQAEDEEFALLMLLAAD